MVIPDIDKYENPHKTCDQLFIPILRWTMLFIEAFGGSL